MLVKVKVRDISLEEMLEAHGDNATSRGYYLTTIARRFQESIRGKDAIIETNSLHNSEICGGKSWYVKGGNYYEMTKEIDPFNFEEYKNILSICEHLAEVD